MKPFDLIEALSGKPVVTKSGKSVSEIHYFKTVALDISQLFAL